jgi:hypothetical protein
MLLRRDFDRDSAEEARDWYARGDIRIPEPLRVCTQRPLPSHFYRFFPSVLWEYFCLYSFPFASLLIFPSLYRDFFPVIITFLRQLPFIGHFLTLPYISTVSRQLLITYLILTCSCLDCGSSCWVSSIYCMILDTLSNSVGFLASSVTTCCIRRSRFQNMRRKTKSQIRWCSSIFTTGLTPIHRASIPGILRSLDVSHVGLVAIAFRPGLLLPVYHWHANLRVRADELRHGGSLCDVFLVFTVYNA